MASLADEMAEIDASIFDDIGETLTFGSLEAQGIFFRRYREITLQDGSVRGLDLSFDCQATDQDWILELDEDDEVEIGGREYRVLARLPEGGDESGLVTIELKTAS